MDLFFKLAQLLLECLLLLEDLQILALQAIKFALALLDHLMRDLQFVIVARFVRFIPSIKVFSHLDLLFFHRDLHLSLQL